MLNVVGFLVVFPVLVQLVNFTCNIALIFKIKCFVYFREAT